MNFSLLHERLRIEIIRRIDRGLLTGKLLAAQTGLQQSHISNFLRRKRRLSLDALDRVLSTQSIGIEELIPQRFTSRSAAAPDGAFDQVPLVSPSVAAHSPSINRSVTLEIIQLPAGILDQIRPRRTVARRDWQRFVAVRVSSQQVLPMFPLLHPQSIVILDRHYNSLAPYRPTRSNIYAVSAGDALVFRYVSLESRRIVLRPHVLEYPVELLEVSEDASPSDRIVGRVCVCISPL